MLDRTPSLSSRPESDRPPIGRFTAMPMASSSEWLTIRMTARSKRGSPMPGMAISRRPDRFSASGEAVMGAGMSA